MYSTSTSNDTIYMLVPHGTDLIKKPNENLENENDQGCVVVTR